MSTTLTSKCTLADAVRRSAPPRTAVGGPVAMRLFGLLMIWFDRVRQRRHVQALDDRMLKDIGLTRADVEGEARKHFWMD